MSLNGELCLISKEPIEEKITLGCKHSFEYLYLYEEIKQQKNRHRSYFKCPYCRTKFNGTIPYYEVDDVEKINYINNTNKTLLPILKCSVANCCLNANKFKIGIYCSKHYKQSNSVKCNGTCKNGLPCKNKALENGFCNIHTETPSKIKNICTEICKSGKQCKKYALLNNKVCNIHNKKDNK
jgi:hypothetical protein